MHPKGFNPVSMFSPVRQMLHANQDDSASTYEFFHASEKNIIVRICNMTVN